MSLLSLSSNFLISYIPNQMTNFVEFWCDFVIGDVYAISYNFNECTPHHHLMFISNFKEKSVTIPCLWHGHIVEAFLYVILKNVCVCVLHEIVSLFSLQRVLLIHFNEHSVSHMCFSFQISMWFCCCFYFFHFPTYIHTHTPHPFNVEWDVKRQHNISVCCWWCMVI